MDFGNTAWVLMSAALVMFMTVPGLALFYGGLVRKKNVLSVLMQCIVALSLVSLQWVIIGYSLSFGPGKGIWAPFIGSLDWAFLKGIGFSASPYFISQPEARVPHLAFIIFQAMFAAITPALIIGAFAERMKFSAYLLFILCWTTLVYDPIAHWVWSSDGWLLKKGVLDFAGGTVVHINAGVAALVTAVMIKKRSFHRITPPHNLPLTLLGGAMLWFGWFGFNAGSSLAADGLAAHAFVITQVAASAAALSWALLDRVFHRRPTILGAATGAVAGLVAITPAAGFVDIQGAMIIGGLSSLICYYMVIHVKTRLGYDDALDAFGVHGIGGIWGALATGLFAVPAVQGDYSGFFAGNHHQLWIQFVSVLATGLYSLVMTVVIFKVVDRVIGMRVTPQAEAIGLDVTEHNERAYTVIE
ncbi:MAG: ammonia channel protein [Elusimicrobia bacterium RIFOXYB2_FULL_49_7]|nr:MAG: ammonia channel protein [Elusimicrobia bacterium RIFOXYB2_FULL_49_7]